MTQTLPEHFSSFSDARKNGFLKVKEAKERGGLVAGYFCTFTPLEILDAAGFMPVSLCGMSEETIPAAEAHLPKNLCPLIKSSYGFALSDKCPYTYFSDLLVGETTCDGKKKMFELLNDIRPTYVLQLPQSLTGDPLTQWKEELHRLIAFLEERFGVNITEEALRAAVRERNRERQARMSLMEVQKHVPPMMWGGQLYSALDGASFLFDAEQRVNDLNALRRAAENGENGVLLPDGRSSTEGKKRIMITGCPIGGVLQKTVAVIEEKGGVVVCFENCSGIKASFQMVDENAPDIVEALAKRYLEIGCAVMAPDRKRTDLIAKLADEYKVDGMIEIDLQACTPYTVESTTIRRCAEKSGLPYLSLETDYSQSDSGQLSTRIEAFLEMI